MVSKANTHVPATPRVDVRFIEERS
jgi:hypothetical protein